MSRKRKPTKPAAPPSPAAQPEPEAEDLYPCTPEVRRRPDLPPGVPVVLADGREWTLPFSGLNPVLTGLRDRLYDQMVVRGTVPMSDVRLVAWMSLLEDYRLSEAEAAALVVVDGEEACRKLVDAVITGVFGFDDEGCGATYTEWALSALLANNIDPSSVPPYLLPMVLEHLTRTGRALPENKMINAAVGMRQRRSLLKNLGGG
jgi:hypothetical protein